MLPSRFSTRRSSIFPMVSSRLMGLWFPGAVGFLPGLGIAMMCAIFQATGKYFNLRHALYILVRCVMARRGRCFSAIAVILSGPGDL